MKSIYLTTTKIFASLFIVSLGLFSCKKELKVNFDTNLTQKKSIHIDQTSGTAVSFSDEATVELENDDTRDYLDKLESIESINSMTYQFKNFTGDVNGVATFDMIINGNVIETQENIVINDVSEDGTVFEISDQEQLSRIAEGLFLNGIAPHFISDSNISCGVADVVTYAGGLTRPVPVITPSKSSKRILPLPPFPPLLLAAFATKFPTPPVPPRADNVPLFIISDFDLRNIAPPDPPPPPALTFCALSPVPPFPPFEEIVEVASITISPED